eukprot:9083079-Karenia_brevis.AAC.1
MSVEGPVAHPSRSPKRTAKDSILDSMFASLIELELKANTTFNPKYGVESRIDRIAVSYPNWK